jgi:FKBP-type peptidyl-prolyl cis-trans isomerase FkpA
MMKSINHVGRCGLRAALAALFVLADACGGSNATPVTSAPTPAASPAPVVAAATPAAAAPPRFLSQVEQTKFAPQLGVHLDSMLRRASGLYVQDTKFGTGGVAARGRSVVVRYQGWLSSGKQFDSGEITVALGAGKTIAAWEEGLLGMRAGGQRLIVSPPNMAYGPRGAGDDIPPNSVLVFLMEVTSVF